MWPVGHQTITILELKNLLYVMTESLRLNMAKIAFENLLCQTTFKQKG